MITKSKSKSKFFNFKNTSLLILFIFLLLVTYLVKSGFRLNLYNWAKETGQICIPGVDVIEKSEGTKSMYFNRACAYFDIGNYAASIVDLTKFIEYDESDPEVYFKRAVANYCLENDDEVEQDLKLATLLNPKYNKQALLAIFRG